MAAFALLEAEAARVVGHDRARAAGLLTQAGLALVASGPVDRVAAAAERAVDLAPAGAELLPAVLQASVLAPLGQHDRARSLLREHRVALQGVDPAGPGHEVLAVAALVHVWMEAYEDAERLLAWYVEGCREQGAVVALAVPLSIWARLHLRRGSLADAARLSEEAVALGEVAAGSFVHAATLSTAALVAANLGEAEACVRHAEQASAIALRLDLTSTLAAVEQTLGFLALGAGDVATAIVHLERARDHTRRFGAVDPSFLSTHADLAEAYARAGRPADAATVIDELASGAEMTGGAWAAAATARCRLLVEGDDRSDEHIANALAAHTRLAQPFELARTQLCAGERLRRARRRGDARAQLTAAHAAFAAVGAERWAERAAHELRAAGGRRTGPSPGDAVLTAREADVCALVAAGATNREVAAKLYLSPRTVEHHLRTVYRKLGVRSRTEMIGRVT